MLIMLTLNNQRLFLKLHIVYRPTTDDAPLHIVYGLPPNVRTKNQVEILFSHPSRAASLKMDRKKAIDSLRAIRETCSGYKQASN